MVAALTVGLASGGASEPVASGSGCGPLVGSATAVGSPSPLLQPSHAQRTQMACTSTMATGVTTPQSLPYSSWRRSGIGALTVGPRRIPGALVSPC